MLLVLRQGRQNPFRRKTGRPADKPPNIGDRCKGPVVLLKPEFTFRRERFVNPDPFGQLSEEASPLSYLLAE